MTKSLRRTIAALAASCLLAATALAANVSGTWTWTQPGRGGGKGGGGGGGGGGGAPREVTLTLKDSGGAVSGKISMPGRDGATTSVDITNVKLAGDTISFDVEREFGGNKFVMKYTGKISGDTLTGEIESPGRDGGTMKREWTAKRAK